jgi:CubicO group peptidase (beta-lactamase class C family)
MTRSLLFAVALFVSLTATVAHAQSPEDELIGLWSHEATFGPAVQGELAMRREGKAWQASLARLDATVEAKGEALSAVFPEGIGRFQGTLRADGQAIEGFWLRPAVTDDPRYPGGSSQAFATPLVLQPAGPDRWRGDVRPLPDPFRLYLKVFRNEDGMLLAAFRDPYQNRTGGASRFRAARAQDKVIFSQPNESGGYDVAFEAMLIRQPDRLKVHWPDLGRDIELQRRTPEQVRDFFPRPPDESVYRYKQPAQAGDGWQTARGRDVGIEEAALARAVQKIIDGDPAARAPALVHSILVARQGKLVLEEYFFGFDRETPHDLRSAGKTFASVMLGAARLQGSRISPQTRVYELLAGRGPFANPDPRKARITLAHLMTHTSGLACNDNDDSSPGNEDTMQTQTPQPDWWKYTLDLPMAHEPGERYAYCSANINLMGAALATATKTWLPDFFDRAVARPLGFGPYHWNLTPTDDGYLGGGAWLLPRDLLKVGQAYLDGGQWQGHRIVDRAWIAESTTSRVAVSPATTGLSEEEFGNYYGSSEDGYAWHLGAIRSGERTYRTFEGTGNGGQILIVAPELELVAVFTGGNYRQGGIWGRWRDQIIGAEIVAGMVK